MPGNLHFYYELPIGVCWGPWIIGMLLAIVFFVIGRLGNFNDEIVVVIVLVFGWVFAKVWMVGVWVYCVLVVLWGVLVAFWRAIPPWLLVVVVGIPVGLFLIYFLWLIIGDIMLFGDPNSPGGQISIYGKIQELKARRKLRKAAQPAKRRSVRKPRPKVVSINAGRNQHGKQSHPQPTKMYHGTPTWQAACDIYFKQRWKSSNGRIVCVTPDFEFATSYSGVNGFVVELHISPKIELRYASVKEYHAPIPEGVSGDYYKFPGITPMKILDFHQRNVTPR
jgi:hypothetical protein